MVTLFLTKRSKRGSIRVIKSTNQMAMKKLLRLVAFIILLFFPNYVHSIPFGISSLFKRADPTFKSLTKQAVKKAVKEAVKEGRDYLLDQLFTTKTIYSNVTFSYDSGLFNMDAYIGSSNSFSISIDTTIQPLWVQCPSTQPSNCADTNMYNSVYKSSGFSTQGVVNFDVFGDTSSKSIEMTYGCECDANGVLTTYGITGLAGLNRASSILNSMHEKRFSYCLPDLDSKGFIFFSYLSTVNENVPHTTILDVPFYGYNDLYVLELESITVNSFVSTPSNLVNHTVIDTVILFSYFASDIYQTIKSALDSSMSSQNVQKTDPVTYSSGYTQPCYYFTGEDLPTTPNVNFTFKGQAVLELDNVNLLYSYSESVVCFAFFGLQGNGFNLIGSYQLINHLVEHDIDNMQVGFAKYDNCSLSYQTSAESAALGNSAALLHLLAFTFIAIMVFAY